MTAPTATPTPEPAGATPRRRPVGIAVGVAVLALALVAACWWLFIRDTGPSAGPLEGTETSGISIYRSPGQEFGYGLAVAMNTGDRPAVLRRIRLVNAPPGLRVIATHAAGPDRALLAQASWPEWPSKEFTDLHPVEGFSVAPQSEAAGERGVEFVFGLRAPDKPGRYVSKAVAVEYTVGGEEHLAYVRSGLAVCVSPSGEGRDCALPTGLRDPIVDPDA